MSCILPLQVIPTLLGITRDLVYKKMLALLAWRPSVCRSHPQSRARWGRKGGSETSSIGARLMLYGCRRRILGFRCCTSTRIWTQIASTPVEAGHGEVQAVVAVLASGMWWQEDIGACWPAWLKQQAPRSVRHFSSPFPNKAGMKRGWCLKVYLCALRSYLGNPPTSTPSFLHLPKVSEPGPEPR